MTASTSAGLILTTSDGALTYGPQYVPVYSLGTSPAYTKGYVESASSVYVCYSGTDMAGGSTSAVVENTTAEDLGITVQSFQGFERDGLIIFEHANYCGTGINYHNSDANISSSFPTGEWGGVSSFRVYKGTWELYTGADYTGGQLTIDGENQFEPGFSTVFVGDSVNDLVKSVKKVKD